MGVGCTTSHTLVDSNDALYGLAPDYTAQLKAKAQELLQQVLADVSSDAATADSKTRQAELALELANRLAVTTKPTALLGRLMDLAAPLKATPYYRSTATILVRVTEQAGAAGGEVNVAQVTELSQRLRAS